MNPTEIIVQKLVTHNRTQENCVIEIDGQTIADIRPASPREQPRYARAVPGFIDIHTHGAAGYDISDCSLEAFRTVADHHLRVGTTSFAGTMVTASLDTIKQALETAREFRRGVDREARGGRDPDFLGIHLEGPWIGTENSGAQPKEHIRGFDEESYQLIESYADIVCMVTMDFHDPKALDFMDHLRSHNILPAAGHDAACDEEILAAFARGLDHVTHIYSNTASFQRRNGYKHLGTLEMALCTPGVSVEMIADDRHITKPFYTFIRHNKACEEIIVVSDSIRCTSMPAGPENVYSLGDTKIIVDDGVAWLRDKSCFAGSVSTMADMYRIMVRDWGVSENDAVRMTSYNPAARFGIHDGRGTVAPGGRADIVLLDDSLAVQAVVKSGNVVETYSC